MSASLPTENEERIKKLKSEIEDIKNNDVILPLSPDEQLEKIDKLKAEIAILSGKQPAKSKQQHIPTPRKIAKVDVDLSGVDIPLVSKSKKALTKKEQDAIKKVQKNIKTVEADLQHLLTEYENLKDAITEADDDDRRLTKNADDAQKAFDKTDLLSPDAIDLQTALDMAIRDRNTAADNLLALHNKRTMQLEAINAKRKIVSDLEESLKKESDRLSDSALMIVKGARRRLDKLNEDENAMGDAYGDAKEELHSASEAFDEAEAKYKVDNAAFKAAAKGKKKKDLESDAFERAKQRKDNAIVALGEVSKAFEILRKQKPIELANIDNTNELADNIERAQRELEKWFLPQQPQQPQQPLKSSASTDDDDDVQYVSPSATQEDAADILADKFGELKAAPEPDIRPPLIVTDKARKKYEKKPLDEKVEVARKALETAEKEKIKLAKEVEEITERIKQYPIDIAGAQALVDEKPDSVDRKDKLDKLKKNQNGAEKSIVIKQKKLNELIEDTEEKYGVYLGLLTLYEDQQTGAQTGEPQPKPKGRSKKNKQDAPTVQPPVAQVNLDVVTQQQYDPDIIKQRQPQEEQIVQQPPANVVNPPNEPVKPPRRRAQLTQLQQLQQDQQLNVPPPVLQDQLEQQKVQIEGETDKLKPLIDEERELRTAMNNMLMEIGIHNIRKSELFDEGKGEGVEADGIAEKLKELNKEYADMENNYEKLRTVIIAAIGELKEVVEDVIREENDSKIYVDVLKRNGFFESNIHAIFKGSDQINDGRIKEVTDLCESVFDVDSVEMVIWRHDRAIVLVQNGDNVNDTINAITTIRNVDTSVLTLNLDINKAVLESCIGFKLADAGIQKKLEDHVESNDIKNIGFVERGKLSTIQPFYVEKPPPKKAKASKKAAIEGEATAEGDVTVGEADVEDEDDIPEIDNNQIDIAKEANEAKEAEKQLNKEEVEIGDEEATELENLIFYNDPKPDERVPEDGVYDPYKLIDDMILQFIALIANTKRVSLVPFGITEFSQDNNTKHELLSRLLNALIRYFIFNHKNHYPLILNGACTKPNVVIIAIDKEFSDFLKGKHSDAFNTTSIHTVIKQLIISIMDKNLLDKHSDRHVNVELYDMIGKYGAPLRQKQIHMMLRQDDKRCIFNNISANNEISLLPTYYTLIINNINVRDDHPLDSYSLSILKDIEKGIVVDEVGTKGVQFVMRFCDCNLVLLNENFDLKKAKITVKVKGKEKIKDKFRAIASSTYDNGIRKIYGDTFEGERITNVLIDANNEKPSYDEWGRGEVVEEVEKEERIRREEEAEVEKIIADIVVKRDNLLEKKRANAKGALSARDQIELTELNETLEKRKETLEKRKILLEKQYDVVGNAFKFENLHRPEKGTHKTRANPELIGIPDFKYIRSGVSLDIIEPNTEDEKFSVLSELYSLLLSIKKTNSLLLYPAGLIYDDDTGELNADQVYELMFDSFKAVFIPWLVDGEIGITTLYVINPNNIITDPMDFFTRIFKTLDYVYTTQYKIGKMPMRAPTTGKKGKKKKGEVSVVLDTTTSGQNTGVASASSDNNDADKQKSVNVIDVTVDDVEIVDVDSEEEKEAEEDATLTEKKINVSMNRVDNVIKERIRELDDSFELYNEIKKDKDNVDYIEETIHKRITMMNTFANTVEGRLIRANKIVIRQYNVDKMPKRVDGDTVDKHFKFLFPDTKDVENIDLENNMILIRSTNRILECLKSNFDIEPYNVNRLWLNILNTYNIKNSIFITQTYIKRVFDVPTDKTADEHFKNVMSMIFKELSLFKGSIEVNMDVFMGIREIFDVIDKEGLLTSDYNISNDTFIDIYQRAEYNIRMWTMVLNMFESYLSQLFQKLDGVYMKGIEYMRTTYEKAIKAFTEANKDDRRYLEDDNLKLYNSDAVFDKEKTRDIYDDVFKIMDFIKEHDYTVLSDVYSTMGHTGYRDVHIERFHEMVPHKYFVSQDRTTDNKEEQIVFKEEPFGSFNLILGDFSKYYDASNEEKATHLKNVQNYAFRTQLTLFYIELLNHMNIESYYEYNILYELISSRNSDGVGDNYDDSIFNEKISNITFNNYIEKYKNEIDDLVHRQNSSDNPSNTLHQFKMDVADRLLRISEIRKLYEFIKNILKSMQMIEDLYLFKFKDVARRMIEFYMVLLQSAPTGDDVSNFRKLDWKKMFNNDNEYDAYLKYYTGKDAYTPQDVLEKVVQEDTNTINVNKNIISNIESEYLSKVQPFKRFKKETMKELDDSLIQQSDAFEAYCRRITGTYTSCVGKFQKASGWSHYAPDTKETIVYCDKAGTKTDTETGLEVDTFGPVDDHHIKRIDKRMFIASEDLKGNKTPILKLYKSDNAQFTTSMRYLSGILLQMYMAVRALINEKSTPVNKNGCVILTEVEPNIINHILLKLEAFRGDFQVLQQDDNVNLWDDDNVFPFPIQTNTQSVKILLESIKEINPNYAATLNEAKKREEKKEEEKEKKDEEKELSV